VNLEILNTSVVVLAKQHNPTILHPSFLVSEEIVPSDWEVAEPPVSTPVFAIVKYKNGIVFNVDENKFQVNDNQIKDDFRKSPISDLARKYAQKLPHVNYKAVGINFKGFVECAKPQTIVIDRFLKPGIANFNDNKPKALGLRIVYELPNVRLRLSCDSGKIKNADNEKEREGILIDANYHMDLPGNEIREEIRVATSQFSQYCDDFVNVTGNVFNLET
jgi:hypothetical protein